MSLCKRVLPAAGAVLALTAVLSIPSSAAEAAEEGISVQLDGQTVSFTDAKPEASSGRTFLPFRAVFESMGAKVDYQADSQTILADRDGVHLEMTLGSKDVKITEDGKTRTVSMDVAPYAKSSRTYVPVRFAAEAFGCNVGWDQEEQTVLILDPEKMLGDATFDLLDRYTAYALEEMDGRNQSVEGDLSMKFTMDQSLTGTEQDVTLPLTADYSGVTSLTAGQMKMNMDLSGFADLAAVDGVSAEELKALKDSLKSVEVEVRLDLERGMYYISCPILAQLMGQESTENTWFSMDMNAMLAATGMDLGELMKLSTSATGSAKAIFTEMFASMPLTSTGDYALLAETSKLYVGMFSDSAFQKNGSTYTSSYSMKEDGAVMTCKTTLTAKGDDIVGMAMDLDMTAADPSSGSTAMSMKMDLSSDLSKTAMSMEMDMAGLMSFLMEMDMNTSFTTEQPVTALPKDAVVVDLLAGMNGAAQ